jgi:hypothetical protein
MGIELLAPVETDEEFLSQAEGQIRGLGKMVVSGIVEIGRKLVEVKERVGYPGFVAFVTGRLGWSERSGNNFIAVFEMISTAKFAVEDMMIDATALYLLATPSTPALVRDEVLAKAVEPGGVSREEANRMVKEAREAEQALATKTVAERMRELTARFNSDIESVKRDAIEQLGVLRGEIDKQRQTFDAELEKGKGPPPKPEPPTLQDAVQLLLRLTGKKKLTDAQYQGLACAIEAPIASGDKMYPPATQEASRAAEQDLKVSSACTRALEYFVTAPPPTEVSRAMPEWLYDKTLRLLPMIRAWLDALQTSIEGK